MRNTAQRNRDPKFIASAILVSLIVLACIVLAGLYAVGGGGDDRAASTDPAISTSDETPDSSACGLAAGEQTIPTSAPNTSWKLLGGTAVPRNAQAGPAMKTADIRTCFANSPTGALFAATWATAVLNEPKYATEKNARTVIAPSDALEQILSSTGDGSPDRVAAQVAGFRVEDYSSQKATVSLVFRSTEGPTAGGLFQVVMPMVWQNGDWKWDYTGIDKSNAVASLNGFTAWSGI